MKKLIKSILLVVLCAIAMTGCNQVSERNPDDFSGIEFVKLGGGDRRVYYHLNELEQSSELVVVGTLIEDSLQEIEREYNENFEKDVISWVGAFNTIEVSRVIKGDIEIGDTVRVTQGYSIVDNRLISMSDLTPMIKGDTWVFFLSTANDCGYYWCTGDSDGRYPVSTAQNQALAVSEYSELGVYDRNNFRDEIYNELVEKYGI